MYFKLKDSLYRIWRGVLSGYGNCGKCACAGYEQSDASGDQCRCGHSYADHW